MDGHQGRADKDGGAAKDKDVTVLFTLHLTVRSAQQWRKKTTKIPLEWQKHEFAYNIQHVCMQMEVRASGPPELQTPAAQSALC